MINKKSHLFSKIVVLLQDICLLKFEYLLFWYLIDFKTLGEVICLLKFEYLLF